jgi:succinate dehydrogenase / fumarate reductase membrane anchor subunit
MATTTARRKTPEAPDAPARRRARERPLGGFELWAWLFMRISGLLLLALAVGHVLIMHLPDGGVSRVDFNFVAVRWDKPFWRIWDWTLLSLALIHGVNGLRNITLDYVRRPGIRLAATVAFHVLGFGIFIVGTIVVFTFDASKWPTVI